MRLTKAPGSLAILVLLTSGIEARASFDGAPWGTSLAILRETFPGGSAAPGEGELLSYFVPGRRVEGRPASIDFAVHPVSGLASVTIRFGEVERGTGKPVPQAAEAMRKTRDAVTAQLTRKFGAPCTSGVTTGTLTTRWLDSDGTAVLASEANGPIALIYQPDAPATKAMRVGYLDTRWGQSVAQIRALYPGGVARPKQNGETDYAALRTVAGRDNAEIIFGFSEQGALESVIVLFAKRGGDVDLVTDLMPTENRDEAGRTFTSVRSLLVARYGAPGVDWPDVAAWGMNEISISMGHVGSGYCVTVGYRPPCKHYGAGL